MPVTRREFVERAGLAATAGAISGCATVNTGVCDNTIMDGEGPVCSARHTFENWSRTIAFQPRRFCRPRTEEELVELVKEAGANGECIRTQGAGHSFSQLLPTNDILVSLDDLNGPVKTDAMRATVPGGMRLKCAIRELRSYGLGFKNIGSVTEQPIAGAFSTGTHGSGLKLGAMSTQVVGVRLVTGNGDIHTITDQDAEDLAAARINLGALGIITEVTLECVEDYQLEYTAYLTTFEQVIGEIDNLIQENDRVVLWWLLLPLIPRNTMILLTKNRVGGTQGTLARMSVDSPNVRRERLPKAESDLKKAASEAPAGGFTKIYQVVSGYDEALTIPLLPVFHRECEYAIPVEKTTDALKAIREVVRLCCAGVG